MENIYFYESLRDDPCFSEGDYGVFYTGDPKYGKEGHCYIWGDIETCEKYCNSRNEELSRALNTSDINLPVRRNNSTLSYADCCLRLSDENRPFEEMSDDDLDSIYFVAFGYWAYRMNREDYIKALNEKRKEKYA